MPVSTVPDKATIRAQIRAVRKKANSNEVFHQSVSVLSVVESLEVFQKSKVVFAYWALPGEVQTQLLIQKWSGAKRFYLPAIVGNELEFRLFESEANMATDAQLGILEPTGPVWTEADPVDLILVPGVAFAENGDRLGRGGGYYDRLLGKFPRTYTLGLAFPYQLFDALPVEPHDQPVDGVVVG